MSCVSRHRTQIAQLVVHRTRDQKIVGSIPSGVAGEFSSQDLTFRANLHSVSVSPRATAVARKRPRSFCQKIRCQVNLNTHAPYTRRNRSGLTVLSRHSVGNYQGNELTRNSSENVHPQSSQLADPGLKSGAGVCELISTLKKSTCGE